jgi:hypothetical protein
MFTEPTKEDRKSAAAGDSWQPPILEAHDQADRLLWNSVSQAE